MIRRPLALTILIGLGACAGGPAPTPRTVSAAERFSNFETVDIAPAEAVSPRPVPCRSAACAPHYPTGPRSNRVEADLVIAFVIDSAGRPEINSASFVKDSDVSEFRDAACTFLEGLRFTFPNDVVPRRILILMPLQFHVTTPTVFTDLKPAENAMRQMPRRDLLLQLNSFHHCA